MCFFYGSALRGEAALKARVPTEGRKNASISPCERSITEIHWPAAFHNRTDQEQNPPCEGELMQITRKGNFFSGFSILKQKQSLLSSIFLRASICPTHINFSLKQILEKTAFLLILMNIIFLCYFSN